MVGRKPGGVLEASDRAVGLRNGDLMWDDFLSANDSFASAIGDPYRVTNILFSSGTTGTPKAIPWTHVTPIKCGMDGHFHQDIYPDEVVAWPTNIGWMMGPWLIYATLLNHATMALYEGAPIGEGFTRFVKEAKVSMLGVVPSLVKTWRSSKAVQGRSPAPSRRSDRPASLWFLQSSGPGG